jgi:hypothetical protein
MGPLLNTSAKGVEMTKTKIYKYGPHQMKTYFKPAGHGWEVGMICEGKTYFMGNFVNKPEANRWWGMLNREMGTFAKKYWVSPDASFTWYCTFLSKHLYTCYYTFLDKLFAKYNKTYKMAWTKEVRKYNRIKKNFDRTEKYSWKTTKAA